MRALSGAESDPAKIPPGAEWPQTLSELAAEIEQHSGNIEAAPREVWTDWCEWKAARLNRLFLELGTSGEAGHITAATIRHGERKKGHNSGHTPDRPWGLTE